MFYTVTCTTQKLEAIFKKCILFSTLLRWSNANVTSNVGMCENQVPRSQEQNWNPRPNNPPQFSNTSICNSDKQMEILGKQPKSVTLITQDQKHKGCQLGKKLQQSLQFSKIIIIISMFLIQSKSLLCTYLCFKKLSFLCYSLIWFM